MHTCKDCGGAMSFACTSRSLPRMAGGPTSMLHACMRPTCVARGCLQCGCTRVLMSRSACNTDANRSHWGAEPPFASLLLIAAHPSRSAPWPAAAVAPVQLRRLLDRGCALLDAGGKSPQMDRRGWPGELPRRAAVVVGVFLRVLGRGGRVGQQQLQFPRRPRPSPHATR